MNQYLTINQTPTQRNVTMAFGFKIGKLYSYRHLSQEQYENLKKRYIIFINKQDNENWPYKFIQEGRVVVIKKDDILLYLGCDYYKTSLFEGYAHCFLTSDSSKAYLVLKEEGSEKHLSSIRKLLKEVKTP